MLVCVYSIRQQLWSCHIVKLFQINLVKNIDFLYLAYFIKKKKDDKDQEMIQSNTTPDLGYHMGM